MKSIIQAALRQFGYRLVPALPQHQLHLMQLADALRPVVGADRELHKFLQFCLERQSESSAQLMQDLFVDFVLDKPGGRFVEFGAYDGITYSNTYYLESVRDWRGLLAEPTPRLHAAISKNRPLAILDKRCVHSRTGQLVEFIETRSADLSTMKGLERSDHMWRFRRPRAVHRIPTVSLDELIETHFSGRDVDYISIDTEGSEWDILQSYRFTGRPSVLTIEHNFTDSRPRVAEFMNENGYVNVFPEHTGFDAWFVRQDLWPSRAIR